MSTLLQPGTAAPMPGASAETSKDPLAGMTLLTAEGQAPRAKAAVEITKNALKRIRIAMAKEGISPDAGGLRLGIQGLLDEQVSFGDDADHFVVIVHNRNGTDPVLAQRGGHGLERRVLVDRDDRGGHHVLDGLLHHLSPVTWRSPH